MILHTVSPDLGEITQFKNRMYFGVSLGSQKMPYAGIIYSSYISVTCYKQRNSSANFHEILCSRSLQKFVQQTRVS